MTYIKSPINYIGNKYKLLPQILDKFPKDIHMLYDVFGGSGTISINTPCEHIYYNDIVPYIPSFFSALQEETIESALTKINNLMSTYELSITNEQGFNRMRSDFNAGNKSWEMFFLLTCFSFNYQYRFNNKQEYNSSFGKNRSCYSLTTKKKLTTFMECLQNKDITFANNDFLVIDFSDADALDLVYCDPPYLITTGNYNDGKRGFKGWGMEEEKQLLTLLDTLDAQGTRFALSNVVECKVKSNEVLKEWMAKYNVHYINADYSNCNYQAKDKSKNSTSEVLITNY